MQKKSFSWGIVGLMFVLFFPVGIWMLIKKVTSEKQDYLDNGKILKLFGCSSIGLGIVCVLAGFTGLVKYEDGTSATGIAALAGLVYGGIGALCLCLSADCLKKGTKYRRYTAVINSATNLRLDVIAAACSTTVTEAEADIQAMLDDGYFQNAYLDMSKKVLVMPSELPQPQRCVKCQCCGATNNLAFDAPNQCEYCGSPL